MPAEYYPGKQDGHPSPQGDPMRLSDDELRGAVASVRVSPGGTRLVVLTEDGELEALVVDVPSARTVAHYKGLTDKPQAAFRSETELVLAHGCECWLCDLADRSHQPLATSVEGAATPQVSCCRVSPDGTSVAVGGAKGPDLVVLDLVGGTKPRVLCDGGGYTEGIYYSPDGRRVACVRNTDESDRWWRSIWIYDTQTGRAVGSLKLPWVQGYVYAVGFHPDTRTVAVGWRSNVLLFDLDPAPSPLDPEVLFGGDSTGHTMGWARPTALFPLGVGSSEWLGPAVLQFSADGSVLSVLCGDGESVRLSVADGRILRRDRPPAPAESNLYGADVSPGGRAAVVGKQLLTWEVPGWGG